MFQRVYGHGKRGAEPRVAVEDTLELLHDDYAYEFQIGWSLWEMESVGPDAGPSTSLRSAQDDRFGGGKIADAGPSTSLRSAQDDSIRGRWVRGAALVRVTGFGPLFDEGYEAGRAYPHRFRVRRAVS